jgi:hypothetical protein
MRPSILDRVTDARGRLRNLQAILLSSAAGKPDWAPTEALLSSLGQLAGRVALDLATIDRDLTVETDR